MAHLCSWLCQASSYKTTERCIELVLHKASPAVWKSIVTDPAKFKGKMTTDWEGWTDEDDAEPLPVAPGGTLNHHHWSFIVRPVWTDASCLCLCGCVVLELVSHW